MSTSYFVFTSSPDDRFAFVTDSMLLRVHLQEGTLQVVAGQEVLKSYPLAHDGQPVSQALFISRNQGDLLEIGSVDYLGNSQLPENYALNMGETDFQFEVQPQEGHIGVLDIRDVGRVVKGFYHPEVVPIVLSIVGSTLQVVTLTPNDTFSLPTWYQSH